MYVLWVRLVLLDRPLTSAAPKDTFSIKLDPITRGAELPKTAEERRSLERTGPCGNGRSMTMESIDEVIAYLDELQRRLKTTRRCSADRAARAACRQGKNRKMFSQGSICIAACYT